MNRRELCGRRDRRTCKHPGSAPWGSTPRRIAWWRCAGNHAPTVACRSAGRGAICRQWRCGNQRLRALRPWSRNDRPASRGCRATRGASDRPGNPCPPGGDRGPSSMSARGAATRRVVELREANAALRERIDVRRGNLAAVAAEVGEAHVIHEDDEDVGALVRGYGRRRR